MNVYFIVDIIIAFFIELYLWSGARDAFYFKKSKTRVRKEHKTIPFWRRLFAIYPKDMKTFAPKHMKVFNIFRVVNLVLVITVCLFNKVFDEIILYVIISKLVFMFLPLVVYGLFSRGDKKNPKGWNFYE